MKRALVWTLRSALVLAPVAYALACSSEETPQPDDPFGGGAGTGGMGGAGIGGSGGTGGSAIEMDAGPTSIIETCGKEASGCAACCDRSTDGGGSAYLRYRDNCLCGKGGKCVASCGASSLCQSGGATPTMECEACKAAAISPDAGNGDAGVCFAQTQTQCGSDQGCTDFLACVRGAACK